MKKKLLTILAMATLALGMSVTASAAEPNEEAAATEATATDAITEDVEENNIGVPRYITGVWKHNSKGWWFEYSDGSYAKNQFLEIGGKTYYFGADGYMKTGWLKVDGYWLYMNSNGSMCDAGWQKINNKWYYFIVTKTKYHIINPEVIGKNNECLVDDVLYYFDKNGALVTGWVEYPNGKWKYFTSNGAAIGWKKIGNYWYYFDTLIAGNIVYYGTNSTENQGKYTDLFFMVANEERYIDGYYYRFDASGRMLTGWVKNTSIYISRGYTSYSYYDEAGRGYTGWIKSSGKWYYIKKAMMLENTTEKIDGRYYHFNKNGVCTGEVTMVTYDTY